MIVSEKPQRTTRLARLLSWISPKIKSPSSQVISEEQFRIEMQKEKSRVDRRSVKSEFAIILMQGIDQNQLRDSASLLQEFQQRLRITDCLGWCDEKLGLLLPETCRKGAEIVAAQLQQITKTRGLKVNYEILIYPDDDEIARNSLEFQDFQFSAESPEREFDVNGTNEIQFRANLDPLFFQDTPPMPLWKRTIDIIGSVSGLVLLSPVFAVAAIAVKCSGPGPIFFKQVREGKDGKPFPMFKFRTMCDNAETMKNKLREFSEQDGPAFKIENDPRLTVVGKYLRKSCIDELPQLINVLRGDMSLVGPRPLPVSESIECLMWQRKRLEVTPGLTCIWQVSGGRTTKFSEWMRMDMEYIRHRSFWLDLKLITRTIWVAVLHRGSV